MEYMIVGGTAVALHGYFRWSYTQSGTQAEKYDLDIWYNPTYENYFKLLNSLEELGQDVSDFREEQTPNPRQSFFRYEMENALSNFRLSFENKEAIDFKGTNIFSYRLVSTPTEI